MKNKTMLWLILMTFLFVQCGPTPKPSRRTSLTTSRTVSRGAGFELSASTDCAEPGEPITFTLSVLNREAQPIELVGTPLLDMVLIKHFEPSVIVSRWSESSTYPSINPRLQPNETQTYTWTWVSADAVGTVSIDVDIQIIDGFGKLWTFPKEDNLILTTGVGETYAPVGGEQMIAKCSDLQPE